MQNKYSIGIFAKKTGVTIRTLHYYDEIDLLNPEVSSSGRRVYTEQHLIILQKIITMKFLGYSLEQIKQFIKDDSWDLHHSLSIQKDMMLQKRKQLDHIIKALDHALHIVDGEKTIDPDIFVSIINGIQEEDEHKKWLHTILPEEKVEAMYDKSESEQLAVEKQYAELVTKMKYLKGNPIETPEVQTTVKELINLVEDLLKDEITTLMNLNIDTETIDPFPNPFSPEEEEWVSKAIEYYLNTLKDK